MINLVVGGLGFVGTSLIKKMEKMKMNSLIVDVDVWGKGYSSIGNPLNFDVIKPTTMNWAEQCIGEIGNKPVRIWHLAANSDIAKASKNLKIDYELTLGSTLEVLKVANNVDCASIEFTSSSAVYGNRIGGSKFKEEDPQNPISTYGVMKLASEFLISIYADRNRIPYHSYRLANIVGPNMTHGLIFDLINKLRSDSGELQVLGDGRQRKTYLHVDDLVEFMIKASSLETSLTVNVGPVDEGLAVSEIVKMILDQTDKDITVKYEDKPYGWPGDVTDSVMDTSKLQEMRLITPRSSEQSVRESILARLHENA